MGALHVITTNSQATNHDNKVAKGQRNKMTVVALVSHKRLIMTTKSSKGGRNKIMVLALITFISWHYTQNLKKIINIFLVYMLVYDILFMSFKLVLLLFIVVCHF